MHVRTGTSGFSYPAWKGQFYPEDLATKKMLAYYASKLSTVEINNTFYRMPVAETLTAWAEQVPDTFRFVLKAPQQITHIKRLKDPEALAATDHFLSVAAAMGQRLGLFLFQLPPNFKQDLPRLDAFLAHLEARARVRSAFEFRHASWFNDETYALLKRRRAALCVAQADEEETPRIATTDVGYVRLRKTTYAKSELEDWGQWLRAQAWTDAYVFFKHDEGTAPQLALEWKTAFGG